MVHSAKRKTGGMNHRLRLIDKVLILKYDFL